MSTPCYEQDARSTEEAWQRAEQEHPRPWRAVPDSDEFTFVHDANGRLAASLLAYNGLDALKLAELLCEAVNGAEGAVL